MSNATDDFGTLRFNNVQLLKWNASGIIATPLAGTGSRPISASSTGVLSATGAEYSAPTTVTGTTYTILASNSVIYFTGSADCTMTMPDASGSGRKFTVKHLGTDGVNLTLAYNTGDSVDGVTSPAIVLYAKQSVTLHDYADEKWGQL